MTATDITLSGPNGKTRPIPNRGMRVDFEAQGSDAVAIYRATPVLHGALDPARRGLRAWPVEKSGP